MNRWLTVLFAFALVAPIASAHHNTQAEYGDFGSDTVYVEGRIERVNWGNPHIFWDIVITGGELPVGEKWRVASHPVNVQLEYGFTRDEYAAGDTLRLHAWLHLRDQPMMWPRAMAVNDGPMKSNLRYTDMIDIANGTFESLGIEPTANLNGSAPGRAGQATVKKLGEMGLLDADGNMIWPPPAAE